MTKEIEQLNSLRRKITILPVIAAKRERFAKRLEEIAGGSIDGALRAGPHITRNIAEIERLKDEIPHAPENLSSEIVVVRGKLQRLEEATASNPALQSAYETHKIAFETWVSTYMPTEQPEPEPEPLTPDKDKKTRPSYEFLFPDGNIFKTGSEKNLKLLEMLYGGKISMSEMAIALYGLDTPDARSNVSAMITRSKPKLNEIGWKVERTEEKDGILYGLVSEHQTIEPAIEPSKTPATTPSKSKEDTFGRDLIIISLPDGQIAETFSPNIASFIEALSSGIVKVDELTIYVFNENTPQNREKLRKLADKAKVNISKIGWVLKFQLGSYELSKLKTPEESDEPEAQSDEKPNESSKPKAEKAETSKQEKVKQKRILPNGVEIEITEGRTLEILDLIMGGVLSSAELALKAHGENNDVNRNRITAVIGGHLNDILSRAGLRLINTTSRGDLNRGVPSHYVFEDISQKAGVETKPSPVPKPVDSAPVPAAPKITPRPAGIVDRPYEPTPQEIRLPEETRAIHALNSQLPISLRINFAQLQAALLSEDRIRISHGQRMFRIYHADEIGGLFESAIRKLKEESETPGLRRRWTPEDEVLWQTSQGLIQSLSRKNDFEEYVRMVKRLVASSERLFNKMTDSSGLEWINL